MRSRRILRPRRNSRRKVIDVNINVVNQPECVVSGVQISEQRGDPLPYFPNLTDLVFRDENTNLLAALLPALDKYDCLKSPIKQKRSPWVRAFCDLYHSAGPWGNQKFRNAPDIESKAKYSFKSYKIPTIYKHLKGYQGDSAMHKELFKRLEDYFDGKE
eukprot:6289515-Ditylum_brightwellii.AAC.1